MRGWFAYELHNHMAKDNSIHLLVGDLGYGVFDRIRDDFPDRFLNTGAAEQSMMDIAVGLALSDKKVFTYTITPFYLRAFETLRTYINHEMIPVYMIGSGRDDDYKHDGFSHDATDFPNILSTLPNILQHYPTDKEEIPQLLSDTLYTKVPQFISLKQ